MSARGYPGRDADAVQDTTSGFSRQQRQQLPTLFQQSPSHSSEMDGSTIVGSSTRRSSIHSQGHHLDGNSDSGLSKGHNRTVVGVTRHTFGLCLLLCVVFLWTLSNFLGSSIFADNSYAKPFFLTYLNTSIFMFAMIPTFLRGLYTRHKRGSLGPELRRIFSKRTVKLLFKRERGADTATGPGGADDTVSMYEENEAFLKPDDASLLPTTQSEALASAKMIPIPPQSQYLSLLATARLALAFCILWFGANYFAMACLQYTTVASTTILTSTSSVWTLLIGAITATEKFTWRKLCGVLASLAGIVIISRSDLSNLDSANTASSSSASFEQMHPARLLARALDEFPDKTVGELALGDCLALLSAIIYGFYTITLKRTTVTAAPKELHMPTFFALVGTFNLVLLFPLFPILHFTGIETFQLPPTSHIWMVLVINSISSFASDICWAYAMVFTSPLVVTVGLSLTIPLSLIGELVIQGRYEGWQYWLGALVVVGSFVFVEREEVKEGVAAEEEDGNEGLETQDGANGARSNNETLENTRRNRNGRLSRRSSVASRMSSRRNSKRLSMLSAGKTPDLRDLVDSDDEDEEDDFDINDDGEAQDRRQNQLRDRLRERYLDDLRAGQSQAQHGRGHGHEGEDEDDQRRDRLQRRMDGYLFDDDQQR